jgi:hypothetical protein
MNARTIIFSWKGPSALRGGIAILSLLVGGAGWGRDGGNNVLVTIPTGVSSGWKTFEILSGGDALGGLAEEGFEWTSKHDNWDGLGAYVQGRDTLRVFINHEAGSDSTFSRVDLDLANSKTWIANGNPNNTTSNQVLPSGQIVKAVSRGWLSVGSGTSPINNPCSGNVWQADTFGAGRGFAETLYLTGEETSDTRGQFWVMDVSSRTLYECPDLGGGSWENATIIDTGRSDTVALLLAEDAGARVTGTAPLRLYVGLKNPGGNFLERNGFSGGTVYYWDPVGAGTDGTVTGLFLGGNGTTVSGTWVVSSVGAALVSKLEDVHTNMKSSSPGFGVEAVYAAQNQGLFTVDFSQVDFVAGDLGASRDSEVELLFRAGTEAVSNSFSGMDNLVWSPNGHIYVNEDDGEGDIWKVDVESLRASYALSDFTPDASQVFDILDSEVVGETSGIIDISAEVGYRPGSVFLTTGRSGALTQNQLVLLVSPRVVPLVSHALNYAAGAGGSLAGDPRQSVGDGAHGSTVTAEPDSGFCFVNWSDGLTTPRRREVNVTAGLSVTANFVAGNCYLNWISGYPSLRGPNALSGGDPDGDGASNAFEYASNLDPTVKDGLKLTAGTGVAGQPLAELRTVSGRKRLVIEYVRRLGVSDLVYAPKFGGDLGNPDGWVLGGVETVTPINGHFERVVREDSIGIGAATRRFARLELVGP